jgi:hypothetical protein
METSLEDERRSIAESMRPSHCSHCGSKHVQFEGCHFPRFFFSCKMCERRIEMVYNWHTKTAMHG